jgi:hypothetical protein
VIAAQCASIAHPAHVRMNTVERGLRRKESRQLAKEQVSEKRASLGRHETNCKICAHPQREEIEREFVNWGSPSKIAKRYELRDRTTVYRHAHAVGLMAKRDRNIRAALSHIIERAGDVKVNAAAVVTAVATYARINSRGQLVERSERVNLSELFNKMSKDELLHYAEIGRLPAWFAATVDEGPDGGHSDEVSGR